VITYSILILIPVIEMKSEISKDIDGLQNRNGIISTTAEIEDLAKARLKKKVEKELSHVIAVNLVANLFALVAVDNVRAAPHPHAEAQSSIPHETHRLASENSGQTLGT
jgi:hypothetical protein